MSQTLDVCCLFFGKVMCSISEQAGAETDCKYKFSQFIFSWKFGLSFNGNIHFETRKKNIGWIKKGVPKTFGEEILFQKNLTEEKVPQKISQKNVES